MFEKHREAYFLTLTCMAGSAKAWLVKFGRVWLALFFRWVGFVSSFKTIPHKKHN